MSFYNPPVQDANTRLANITAALVSAVATPPTVTITPEGTTGSTSYSYVVAAYFGSDTVPTLASTSTGNATLSSTNYNQVSWSPVLSPSGLPVTYNVYRTVGGSTQGLIASGLSGVTSLNDTGLASTSGTAPVRNTTVPNSVGSAPIRNITTTGASVILPNPGMILLSGASACTPTLALPVATVDDGTTIKVVAQTAHAHTITTPANGINGTTDTATFAAVGDEVTFQAWNGIWVSNGVQTVAHLTEV